MKKNLEFNLLDLLNTIFLGIVAIALFLTVWVLSFQLAIFLGADNIHGIEIQLAFCFSLVVSYLGTSAISNYSEACLKALIGKSRGGLGK